MVMIFISPLQVIESLLLKHSMKKSFDKTFKIPQEFLQYNSLHLLTKLQKYKILSISVSHI